MKSTAMMLALTTAIFCGTAAADISQAVPMTHMELQAVDEFGDTLYTGPEWIILEGILLNNPEEWLDPTPSDVDMGGQWQIVIQGEVKDPNEAGDPAGTACWMGQNYGSLGWVPPDKSYSDEGWLAEIYRLNYDPNSLLTDRPHAFRAGDRVRVTGRSLFRNGKRLINERHNNDPSASFVLELVKPAVGLPQPIEITLEDVKDDNNNFIFGHDPRQGGELYQSRRVRLEDVYIIDGQWEPLKSLTVADAPADWTRTLEVRLGYGEGILRYSAPEPDDKIDVIGILDQSHDTDYTAGYYIFALNYDGSRRVLGDASNLRGNLPGDINNDFKVDLLDFAELAEHWLTEFPGLYPRP